MALHECTLPATHSPAVSLGKMLRVPTEQDAGWATHLASKPCRGEKSHDPARDLTTITHSSIQATAYQPQYHSYPFRASPTLNIGVIFVKDGIWVVL